MGVDHPRFAMAPLASEEEERAAIKLQALVRGKSDREYFNLVRDEEACVCHAELEPTPDAPC